MYPDVFTGDYAGEPGQRTFYLQARGAPTTLTFLVEKQQVAALADKLRELLMMVDATDTVGAAPAARDPALALEGPLEPEWRVGTIGLAYDEEDDVVVVLMQPVETEEEAAVAEPEDTGVRFVLRRDQVRAYVLHALAVVEEGRPTCQLCGLPMDPGGHNCPASNGHRIHS